MLLSNAIDAIVAGHRARKVQSWKIGSAMTSCMLQRKIFLQVSTLLKRHEPVPGLGCPVASIGIHNDQYTFVASWLHGIEEHYRLRTRRCHSSPEVFDSVYGIFHRLIKKHVANEAMEAARASRAAEIRDLLRRDP